MATNKSTLNQNSATLNYYRVLQVQPDAEPEVVQAAYRTLSKKYHPDTNKQPGSEGRMQQLNEAYATLSNSRSRADYDAKLARETPPMRADHSNASRPREKDWSEWTAAEVANEPRTRPTNPRAADYKPRSFTKLGQELERAILLFGPLDAFWLAKRVSEFGTLGQTSKMEVQRTLNSDNGRVFKIAWTDGGRPIWDLRI